MASRTRHAQLASLTTQGKFLSRAARRTVRQAARLADELDFGSFEVAGIVWHRRAAQQPPAAPAQHADPKTGQRMRKQAEHVESNRQKKRRERQTKYFALLDSLNDKARLHRLHVVFETMRRVPQPSPLPMPPLLRRCAAAAAAR